jgi:hypothetical protein
VLIRIKSSNGETKYGIAQPAHTRPAQEQRTLLSLSVSLKKIPSILFGTFEDSISANKSLLKFKESFKIKSIYI